MPQATVWLDSLEKVNKCWVFLQIFFGEKYLHVVHISTINTEHEIAKDDIFFIWL